MDFDIKPGQYYRHFKGGYYIIIGIGKHTETCEKMVVYKYVDWRPGAESELIWIRPYDDFVSKVDKEKYPDSEQEYRFQYMGFGEGEEFDEDIF